LNFLSFYKNKISAPDDQVFRQLATVYASNHGTMKTGHVCEDDDFQGGITNGAKW
jgi:carboxypeptidase D